MRLIDADTLEPHEIYDGNGFTEVVYMDDIREMPTVDIIYCKECKYGSRDPFDMRPIWCFYCHHYSNETDFCSRGEQKDEIN